MSPSPSKAARLQVPFGELCHPASRTLGAALGWDPVSTWDQQTLWPLGAACRESLTTRLHVWAAVWGSAQSLMLSRFPFTKGMKRKGEWEERCALFYINTKRERMGLHRVRSFSGISWKVGERIKELFGIKGTYKVTCLASSFTGYSAALVQVDTTFVLAQVCSLIWTALYFS